MSRAKAGLNYLELALGKVSNANVWEDKDIRHLQEVLGKLKEKYKDISKTKETIQ